MISFAIKQTWALAALSWCVYFNRPVRCVETDTAVSQILLNNTCQATLMVLGLPSMDITKNSEPSCSALERCATCSSRMRTGPCVLLVEGPAESDVN